MLSEGTAKMNFAEISKKAAMMGGSLNITVGFAQTTISGSVLSEYAPDFIKLIRIWYQSCIPCQRSRKIER